MYTLEMNEGERDKIEMIHDVLSNVYGGTYPMFEIMAKVNRTSYCWSWM